MRTKEEVSAYNRSYRLLYKERIDAQIKAWHDAHPESSKHSKQAWHHANKKKENTWQIAYNKHKYKTDPDFRLTTLLRKRLGKALKGGYKSGSAVKSLGCTIPELRVRFESLFQPGMTWENHGQWHIDHIRPLASFDLQDPLQLAQACNFSNLQPLWATENLSKGSR